MKNEKDIRVEMIRVEGDFAPFVEVDYMDQYAQEHTGLMLLDSQGLRSIIVWRISRLIIILQTVYI